MNWATWNSTAAAVELLFQVLTEREEEASVAIAGNQPFSGWSDTFTRLGRNPRTLPKGFNLDPSPGREFGAQLRSSD
jgi:hypothetical protein